MQFTTDNTIIQLTMRLRKTETVRKEHQFKLILEKIGKLSARGKQFEERQVFAVKSRYLLRGLLSDSCSFLTTK